MNPFAAPLGAWKALTTLGRIAAVLVALIALMLIWWVFVGRPAHDRNAAAAARVGEAMGNAHAASGAVAAQAVGENAQADAHTAQIQRENSNVIDKAPDAGTAVPATSGALRAGLCRYEAYRNTPECLQRARP